MLPCAAHTLAHTPLRRHHGDGAVAASRALCLFALPAGSRVVSQARAQEGRRKYNSLPQATQDSLRLLAAAATAAAPSTCSSGFRMGLTDQTSLHQADDAACTVHPAVLFSIVDHYSRREEEQNRVIGTLLGTIGDDGEVTVCSCFPVPHTETEEQVAVNTDFHATMLQLHQRVFPKQQVCTHSSTDSSTDSPGGRQAGRQAGRWIGGRMDRLRRPTGLVGKGHTGADNLPPPPPRSPPLPASPRA